LTAPGEAFFSICDAVLFQFGLLISRQSMHLRMLIVWCEEADIFVIHYADTHTHTQMHVSVCVCMYICRYIEVSCCEKSARLQ